MSSLKNFATGAGHKSGFLTSSKTTQGIGNLFNTMTNKDTYFTGKGARLKGNAPSNIPRGNSIDFDPSDYSKTSQISPSIPEEMAFYGKVHYHQ